MHKFNDNGWEDSPWADFTKEMYDEQVVGHKVVINIPDVETRSAVFRVLRYFHKHYGRAGKTIIAIVGTSGGRQTGANS